jgi:hypothetical protein
MATIGTASHSNYLNSPRRSYITTAAFQNDIFRYTTSTNPQTFEVTGTLTSLATVGTGTAANCPANRVLRENGKKLYPSGLYVANNTTYAAPNPGVTTYMVGVYDPVSFLNGFIDPNSQVFAPYNTDKPEYVPRGIDPNSGAVDQGPPVYTLGSVTAGTNITATGTLTGTELVIQNPVTITQATTTAQTCDCSLGSYFNVVVSTNDNFAINATNVTSGQIVVMVLNSGSAANTPTISFGTNIRPNNAAATQAITSAAAATITFIGSGTTLVELCRIAVIAAS